MNVRQEDFDTRSRQIEMFRQIAGHFITKYGNDRALVIVKKISPVLFDSTVDEAIRLGEAWHRANVLLKSTTQETP